MEKLLDDRMMRESAGGFHLGLQLKEDQISLVLDSKWKTLGSQMCAETRDQAETARAEKQHGGRQGRNSRSGLGLGLRVQLKRRRHLWAWLSIVRYSMICSYPAKWLHLVSTTTGLKLW